MEYLLFHLLKTEPELWVSSSMSCGRYGRSATHNNVDDVGMRNDEHQFLKEIT